MVLTTSYPGTLRDIWPPPPATLDEGIDIVVIPGVWTPYTPDQRRKCSWLKPLAASTTTDTRVFLFTYQILLNGSSVWQQLIDQGYCLVQAIRDHREAHGMHDRPILFICHSLGGIVLKRALWIIHQGQINDLGNLEHVLAGIIFLGSPHLTSKADSRWDRWRLILKANRKDISKDNLQDPDISKLAELCSRFEYLNLQIPILSAYENRESKIRESIFPLRTSNSSILLVDEQHARTGAKYEEVVGVDSDHNNLFVVPTPSLVFDRLVSFLRSITEHAPRNVANLLQRLDLNDNLAVASISSYQPTPESQDVGTRSQSHTGSQGGRQPLQETPDFTRGPSRARLPAYLTENYTKNTGFVGREDILHQIDEAFGLAQEAAYPRNDPVALRSFVLCGLGGVGKTEIAVEYMLSRKHHFEAIMWLSADTTQKLTTGFTHVTRGLGLEDGSGNPDEIASREILKGWLSNPIKEGEGEQESSMASWLIVFDNVDDPEILYDFWPADGTGCVIITTRNPLSKDSLFQPTAVRDVPSFGIEEAVPLLQSLSHRGGEPRSLESCRQIVDMLGGLPLAITQMASVIHYRQLSLADFIDYYHEDAKKLQKMRPFGRQTTYGRTISSVWAIESLSAEALALLRVLSFLDPDRIPESILTEGAKDVQIPDYPSKKSAYFDARLELTRSSIITRDIENNVLRIHRLVQDVVRQEMTLEQTAETYNGACVLISALWPFVNWDQRNKVDRWRQCDMLVPHIAQLRTLFEPRLRQDEFRVYSGAAALMNEVAWYLVERARGDEIIHFAAFSEVILTHPPGDEPASEERLKKLLSDSYQYQTIGGIDTGAPTTLATCKKWIDMLIKRLASTGDREDGIMLASGYSEIGMAYMREGEQTEAISSFEMARDTMRNLQPPSKIDLTWPAIHLGKALAINDRADEIDGFVLDVLEAREKAYGKDDTTSFETGKLLMTLGDIRMSQNRLEEAGPLYQRALAIFRATIGDNHYVTADCCYSLAKHMNRDKRYDEARSLWSQSLKVYGDTPWYKPQAARTAFRQGRLLRFLGSTTEGNLLLDKAVRLRKELVPDDDRSEEQLVDRDFDVLVYYFSR